jgi:hypothetical protein
MKMAMDTAGQSADLISRLAESVPQAKPANIVRSRPGNMLRRMV